MKRNMGNADRIIRSLIAALIIALSFSGIIYGVLGTILLVVSGIFLLTSLFAFCPLYTLLGINSCPRKQQ